jgi:hypothetical protein
MAKTISFTIQARDNEFGLILSSPVITSDCTTNCSTIKDSINNLKDQINQMDIPISQLFFKVIFNENPTNEVLDYFKDEGL